MNQQEKKCNYNKRAGELCKNVTRKKIVEIARKNDWEILSAGREQLKATRKGYCSVSIPGHNNGTVIPYKTAYKVIKSLLEPSISELANKEWFEAYQKKLELETARADKVEAQLEKANFIIASLNDDVEAGFQLAAETENKNRNLSKEIHRYSCWIRGLKQKIANLIGEKTRQEAEMLLIADEVEQQELRIQGSAELLTEFSIKLKPTLRQELKQIIRYLTEEST
ncbi:hypothetical protein IQ238_20685 [Pleurocapsales cyanobacterium LEGE 06147]|nr:hypothetical protein [Pleurocapsales cyanobacterium LEGE 06147]